MQKRLVADNDKLFIVVFLEGREIYDIPLYDFGRWYRDCAHTGF